MGLPEIKITFEELGISAIRRGEKGTVAVVLYDKKSASNLKDLYTMTNARDIPEGLSEYNKDQIQKIWLGYVTSPRKVHVLIEEEKEGVNKGDLKHGAFNLLETLDFDILTVPGVAQAQVEPLIGFVKSLNENGNKGVIAVLPNAKADSEYIVNFTTPVITTDTKTYETTDYCSRIAGIIAGTPLQISCTYVPLKEVVACTNYKKEELDQKIEDGQLVLFNDGKKVKIARGVNSLTTKVQNKREGFTKIKLVQLMNLIRTDIKRAAEDNYLGKYANSYDNKILLCSAIGGYFKELEREGLAEKGQSYCRINVEAQRNYLESTGYKTTDGRGPDMWEELDILYGDTDDKVFLKARVKLLDAIEEITLPIEI